MVVNYIAKAGCSLLLNNFYRPTPRRFAFSLPTKPQPGNLLQEKIYKQAISEEYEIIIELPFVADDILVFVSLIMSYLLTIWMNLYKLMSCSYIVICFYIYFWKYIWILNYYLWY